MTARPLPLTAEERRLGELEAEFGALRAHEERAADLDALRGRYATDPVAFIREVLHDEPWEAQVRIAELMRDHPFTVVRSCNGAGKDWIAARLAVWAATMGWSVIITGPTERQVKTVVMGEAFRAWQQGKLPGDFYELAWRLDRTSRAGILAYTSNDVSRLTGQHAPKLLAIATEAQGLPPFVFEALLANLTGDDSRLLVVGNPLVRGTKFYDYCRSPHWQRVVVRATDHPNVVQGRNVIPGAITPRFVETIATEYGLGSSVYAARVMAEFPDEADDVLCRRAWLERAAERWQTGDLEQTTHGQRLVVGVDVARFGSAQTVACVRHGRVIRRFEAWGKADLMQTAAKLGVLLDDLGIGPKTRGRVSPAKWGGLGPEPVAIIDAAGVGGGVADRLREVGYLRVSDFNGGTRAGAPDRFVNRRCEAFWGLRQLLERDQLALAWNDRVVDELCSMKWKITPESKIALEPKTDLAERLGRSCDWSDALCMAASDLTTPSYGMTASLAL